MKTLDVREPSLIEYNLCIYRILLDVIKIIVEGVNHYIVNTRLYSESLYYPVLFL